MRRLFAVVGLVFVASAALAVKGSRDDAARLRAFNAAVKSSVLFRR